MQVGDAAWKKRRRRNGHAEKRRVFREKLKEKKKKIIWAAVLGAAAGVLVQSLWEVIPRRTDQKNQDNDIETLMPITKKEREDAANACAKYLAALQREEMAEDAMTYSPLMSLDPASCQRTILEYRIVSDREDLAGSYAAQTLGTEEYEELSEILYEDADSTEDLQALRNSAVTGQEKEEEFRGKQARYIYELVTFGGDDGHSAYTIEQNGTEQETEIFPEDDPAYEGYEESFEEGAWTDGSKTEETDNTETWNPGDWDAGSQEEPAGDVSDLPESYGTFADDGSRQKTRIGDTWTTAMYVVIRGETRSQCDAMEAVVERAILVHTKDLILSGDQVELHLVSKKETGSADANLAHLQEEKTRAWQSAAQERESIEENDLQVLSWREQKLFHKLLKEEQARAEEKAERAAEAAGGDPEQAEESPWTWVLLEQNTAEKEAEPQNDSVEEEGKEQADKNENEENEEKNPGPFLMAASFQIPWIRIQGASLGALLAVLVYFGILWLRICHLPLVWCREDVEAVTDVRILGSILTQEKEKSREAGKGSEKEAARDQNRTASPEEPDEEDRKVPRQTGMTALRIKGACEDRRLKKLFWISQEEDDAVHRLQEVLLALHIHLLSGNPDENPKDYEAFQKSDAVIVSCTAARTTRQTLQENIALCREEGKPLLGIVLEERPVPQKKKRKTLAERRLEMRQQRQEARDRRKKAREMRREERRRRRQLRRRMMPLRNQGTEPESECSPFTEVSPQVEPEPAGENSGITLEDLPEWKEDGDESEESEESITPEEIAVIRRVLERQEQELIERRRRAEMVREKRAAKAGTPAGRKEDMTAETGIPAGTAKNTGAGAAAGKRAAERRAV